jgi:hypothetical protein
MDLFDEIKNNDNLNVDEVVYSKTETGDTRYRIWVKSLTYPLGFH